MINLSDRIAEAKDEISSTGFYYLWWNAKEKKVYLTENPPLLTVVSTNESGLRNHMALVRNFGELHQDYFHFGSFMEDKMITVYQKTFKEHAQTIESIKRILEKKSGH